jgi:hypothetical protein
MNASTIVLGGSGGTSLLVLDTPKPFEELNVGSIIWNNWASINYTFIRLFSQAEHVRRKTQLEPKFDSGNASFPGLRISCAQLKTMRIHDSKLQTMAGVWSKLLSNLESKANVITCGRIWYRGLILAVGNKNSQLKHQGPKNPQISTTTQWPNYAHFWYSKVELDWIRICSKNCICRGMLFWKTVEQRLTKLSITLCREFLKSWAIHSRFSIW